VPTPPAPRAAEPDPEPEPPAAEVVSAPAEPAPAPQPPSLERLLERWQEAILPEIQRRSPPLHSLIVPARPVSWDDHEVVIGLPASTSFAIKMVDTPQNSGIVTELVAQALGATPRVRFVVLGEESADTTQAEQPPAEQVSEHELMSRLAEEFDAHEVQ
jgi:hypothetical protein